MSALAELLRDRVSVVWLALIGATIGSYLVGTDSLVSPAKLAGALVIVVAFTKVRFVGLYFMELRDAPIPLRLISEGYVVGVCAVMITMYLAGGQSTS
jgi:hypothetical protein